MQLQYENRDVAASVSDRNAKIKIHFPIAICIFFFLIFFSFVSMRPKTYIYAHRP